MRAKQLIKQLSALVKEHGDKNILVRDPETGWHDTVGDVRVIVKNEWQRDEGFLLDIAEL